MHPHKVVYKPGGVTHLRVHTYSTDCGYLGGGVNCLIWYLSHHNGAISYLVGLGGVVQ